MSQPRTWFWGLIPVAGLLLAAGAVRQANMEADLGQRSTAVLSQAGLDWAKVALSGRDLVLSGEAPEPDARGKASSLADQVFGVRIVSDKTTLLPEAKPFAFEASWDAGKLVLSGSIPPGAARDQLLSATRQAFPGTTPDDRLKAARGAPASFSPGTAFGLTELAKLSSGKLAIVDQTLSLTGRAADSAKFADVRAKLAALPAGISLGKGLGEGDILPPLIKPYSFEAEKTEQAVVLGGYVPNELTRRTILAAANALGKPVTDRLLIGDGAANSFVNGVDYGLGQLGRLTTGRLAISDQSISLTGHANSGEAYDDVRRRLASLPAGLTLGKGLGNGDITTSAVRPYLFSAVRGERDLTLSGFVPDARTRTEIVEQARKFFEGDRIQDQLQVGTGAPAGFAALVRGALQDLSRLLPGASLSISDAQVALRGLAPLDRARDQAMSAFRARLPGGFTASTDVNTAPLPPPITVASECNFLFQDLLGRAQINFDTGSATIAAESFGLLDRLVVVVRRCQDASVEISGHTDSVGSLESNMALSEARAKSVVDYLATSGIVGERVVARGFGPTQPRASNETAEGRAQNRRIEFKVQ